MAKRTGPRAGSGTGKNTKPAPAMRMYATVLDECPEVNIACLLSCFWGQQDSMQNHRIQRAIKRGNTLRCISRGRQRNAGGGKTMQGGKAKATQHRMTCYQPRAE